MQGRHHRGTSTAGGSTRDAESPHTQDANRLAGSPPCDAEQQPQRIAEAQVLQVSLEDRDTSLDSDQVGILKQSALALCMCQGDARWC